MTLAAGAAGAVGATACDDTLTGDSTTPVTGVVVSAETVTRGKGCGRGVGQVYKYAVAAVQFTSRRLVGGGVYDCFTDGTFLNLPADDNGGHEYDLFVYAYDATAYDTAGGATIAAAAGGGNPLTSLPGTLPTWTTSCHSPQIDTATALAVCDPLTVGLGGADPSQAGQQASITLDTTSFARADDAGNGTYACGADYVTVRHAELVGSTTTQPVDVACADKITLSGVQVPAAYTIGVALLGASGNLVGQTTCTANTVPGATVAAVCQPVP